jgi:hypothetical protein
MNEVECERRYKYLKSANPNECENGKQQEEERGKSESDGNEVNKLEND